MSVTRDLETGRPILLVGSVPLESANDVFDAASSFLGARMKRIPDGETGSRLMWILWQGGPMSKATGIEPAGSERLINGVPFQQYRIKRGQAAEPISFGTLGYADAARRSYADFLQKRADGRVKSTQRFQICLPTPIAVKFAFMLRDETEVRPVWPVYEAAMLRELAQISAAIPAQDLAIQWDIATELTTLLEKPDYTKSYPIGELVAAIARVSNAVPEGAELGLHFCYGDPNHKHVVEPPDTCRMVNLANLLAVAIKRPITWMHMPVPRDRDDDPYFAPLKELRMGPETELFLGVIHLTDGLEGAKRRIAAARKVVKDFGVATECGFGRRNPETTMDLLRLHRQVAALD